jgi:hypothetical protein
VVAFGSRTMIAGSFQLYRRFPAILKVLTIIRPETLVRWHKAGWRWKSRPRGGRPQIETELRVLIRWMSVENPLWGAPRNHANCSSSGLRSRSRASPSTRSSGEGRPVMDGGPSCTTRRIVVPTIGFGVLHAFVIARLDRRILSGSMSQHIRPPIGSRDKSRRPPPGTRLRAT